MAADHCRNEHPPRIGSNASRNPFAPLQENPENRSTTSTGRAPSSKDAQSTPYSISRHNLTLDLQNERPQWLLSSYAPGKDAPIQLFGGYPREQSFEEMRVRHYHLALQGKQDEAIREAQNLVQSAESQIKTALADVDGAIKYILDGEQQHPNRFDICKARGGTIQPKHASVANPQQPSFGQPSAPSTFGRPATLGPPSSSVSTINNNQSPAFAHNSFGQPSFGQPASLGQSSTSFIQSTSPFGQPVATAPAFGKPSAPMNNLSVPQQPSNPFSHTTQASTAAENPFANNNTLANTGPQSTAQTTSSSPFARTGPNQQSTTFGQSFLGSSATANIMPNSTAQSQKDTTGKLRSWNGRSVSYVDDQPCFKGNDGNWHRIWFPDGPPSFINSSSLPDEVYDTATQENYEYLKARGAFRDGVLPLIPPKKAWCDWNL